MPKRVMTLREIKTIDMDPNDFESEEKFQYCKGLQDGAEIAEETMKKRAKHFVEIALKQIEKKHDLDLGVDGYLKNLIYMMEWEEDVKKFFGEIFENKPKFKVGDCLSRKGYEDCVVKSIYDNVTYVCENDEGETHISVDEQDLWTLNKEENHE